MREAAKEKKDRLVTELADLYEVVDALLFYYGIEDELVRDMQNQEEKSEGDLSSV
ncbi:MAG: hypothetical protein IMW89_13820 [Ktedonobacteraceae bacterium]|nr:hypothetical protein [Ktedonobacteraceae bacterium]